LVYLPGINPVLSAACSLFVAGIISLVGSFNGTSLLIIAAKSLIGFVGSYLLHFIAGE
jgi:hypothetical protein